MAKDEYALGDILAEEFPHLVILPQHHIRYRSTSLYLDYYIPALHLAFEYDGKQHFTFIRHFHGSKDGFKRSLGRDRLKEQWCEENGIKIIRIRYNEKLNKQLIRRKIKNLIND
jgi:very-short-patch-repair endonuclease